MSCCLLIIFFDLLLGELPAVLHPTVWIGYLIAFLQSGLYRRDGAAAKFAGTVLVLLVVVIVGGITWGVQFGLNRFIPSPWNQVVIALVASITVAWRCLLLHIYPIFKALCRFRTVEARRLLARVVGRDTEHLSRTEVCRATIETAAEALGDGIVSPLFWFSIFGLPGAFVYRAINTMDSMLGYKNDKYRNFGWAAARLDDLANYLPVRFTALPDLLLAALCFGHPWAALKAAVRDHVQHLSPNAGWLEAATAGFLGIRLGGLNYYQGQPREYPVMNPDGAPARPRMIRATLRLVSLATIFAAIELDAIAILIKYLIAL